MAFNQQLKRQNENKKNDKHINATLSVHSFVENCI